MKCYVDGRAFQCAVVVGVALCTSLHSTAAPLGGDPSKVVQVLAFEPRPREMGIAISERVGRGQYPQIIYRDQSAGETVDVSSAGDTVDVRPSLSWSADGRRLGFFSRRSRGCEIRIWDALLRKSQSVPVGSPGVANCTGSNLIWSADSRYLFVTVRTPSADDGGISKDQSQSPSYWRALLLPSSSNSGVAARVSLGENQSSHKDSIQDDAEQAEIISVDIETSAQNLFFKTGDIVNTSMSPDGKSIAVVVRRGFYRRARQFVSDIYAVPSVDPERHFSSTSDLNEDTHRVKPIAPGIPLGLGPVVWSPDSSSIAYVERGAYARGNIRILSLETGHIENITEAPLPRETGEVAQFVQAANVDESTPNAKFNDADDLVWDLSGNSIYVLRRTLIRRERRTRLWRISKDGKPENMSIGMKGDIGLPLCQTSAGQGKSTVVVELRLPDGNVGFAARLSSGKAFHTVVEPRGEVLAHRSIENRNVYFTHQEATMPEEMFVLGSYCSSVQQLTHLNGEAPSAVNLGSVSRISWKSPRGDLRFGALYLPAGHTSRARIVLQIYPRDPEVAPLRLGRYLGASRPFFAPLNELFEEGYAIFKPDIPVAGGGDTCDDLSRNVVAAMNALKRSRLVDTDKAAIFGDSFGGWSVNCIITRTKIFKAAVSVSGFSDLISLGLSAQDTAGRLGLGGGQVQVGSSIWKAPLEYWNESPIAMADRVTTPLLLVHGKLDDTIPVEQSVEMFRALSMFGKPVTLVTYDGVGHTDVQSVADYGPRVKSWIEGWLN